MDERLGTTFGDLLRHQRWAAGMTQEELAERANLSLRAISDLERGARNRPFRATVQLLADALGLERSEREVFATAARRPRPAPLAVSGGPASDTTQSHIHLLKLPAAMPRHNLSVRLSSFVGREHELAVVSHLVETNRLVTLTGTGGVGKSSLAIETARSRVDAYADGIWLVELAPLADPSLIVPTIVAVLGVREVSGRPSWEMLAAFLAGKHVLLVLDNCEHLIDACAEAVESLLRTAPGVHILATSREPLRSEGEVAFRIPSLETPPRELSPVEELSGYAAVCLFVERAMRARPDFAGSALNLRTVATICQRLDGIPLALELVAARVGGQSLEQIARRLDDRTVLRIGGKRTALPRHQTLRASIEWSHALLAEAEQVVFRLLAVFAGGFTLDAAEAVIAFDAPSSEATTTPRIPRIDREHVLLLLGDLVDKSLVQTEERDGEVRYRLLQMLHQYGWEQLASSGEAKSCRRRHAMYYREQAQRADAGRSGSHEPDYVRQLNRELDNLRAALRWLLEDQDARAGLELALALESFWWYQGRTDEALSWFQQFLALPGAAGRDVLSARVLSAAGLMALKVGDRARGRALSDEALTLARDLGDPGALAWVLLLGALHQDHQQGRRCVEESLALYRRLGDRGGMIGALASLGRIAFAQGEREATRAYLEEGLTAARQMGNRSMIATTLEVLGEVRGTEEDAEARADLLESLGIYRELGDLSGVARIERCLGRLDCLHRRYAAARDHYRANLRLIKDWTWPNTLTTSLDGLAAAAAGLGQARRALRLAGASARWRVVADGRAIPAQRAELQGPLASARWALGSGAAAAAWAEGQAMTLEQATAYALEDEG